MRYEIQHRTTYRYHRPVTFQSHRMMLSPRGSHDLVVLTSAIETSPPARLTWTQDVFGNLIATGVFEGVSDAIVITAAMTVEQSAIEWPIFAIALDAQAFPFVYAAADLIDLGALRESDPADTASAVLTWALPFVAATHDTLDLLKAINAGVLDTVTYRMRDEEGTQTAAETLRLASGSCRDIAALFIAVARRLGFGARAVSGYLHDPNALSERGATHAWAEVYLPGAGWVTFDPTRRRVGAANLIPVAVGRENGQIMPIVGGYFGAPSDFAGMEVDVKVSPVD